MHSPPIELVKLQADFSRAIFGQDDKTVLKAVRTNGELTEKQQVGIYRNSVHGILWKHLCSRYKVCETLLGKQFFEQLCDAYIDTWPPETPFLNDYGAEFSRFMRQQENMADFSWVADVADLEWSRHLAWLATNQPESDFSELAESDSAKQLQLVFFLPYSAVLLTSEFAIGDIWLSHQPENHPDKPDLESIQLNQPSHLIIWRKSRVLLQNNLNLQQWRFLCAVKQGATLESLTQQFVEELPALLSESINNGWIISFSSRLTLL